MPGAQQLAQAQERHLWAAPETRGSFQDQGPGTREGLTPPPPPAGLSGRAAQAPQAAPPGKALWSTSVRGPRDATVRVLVMGTGPGPVLLGTPQGPARAGCLPTLCPSVSGPSVPHCPGRVLALPAPAAPLPETRGAGQTAGLSPPATGAPGGAVSCPGPRAGLSGEEAGQAGTGHSPPSGPSSSVPSLQERRERLQPGAGAALHLLSPPCCRRTQVPLTPLSPAPHGGMGGPGV